MVQILGFSARAVRFRGNFEEIGIAKVLLKTNTYKPRRAGKFQGCDGCRFLDV